MKTVFTERVAASYAQGETFEATGHAEFDQPAELGAILLPSLTSATRKEVWENSQIAARRLHKWLHEAEPRRIISSLGIVIEPDEGRKTIFRTRDNKWASVEVHAVRLATRLGEKGWAVPDLVVEITQRRRGYFQKEEQEERDADGLFGEKERGDFVFRAGVTLLMNPVSEDVRRVIRSNGRIDDDQALMRMRWYLTRGAEPANAFAAPSAIAGAKEPFALLHRHHGE